MQERIAASLRDRTLCALDRPTRRLGGGYVTMMGVGL
jgi:hypothetical protein